MTADKWGRFHAEAEPERTSPSNPALSADEGAQNLQSKTRRINEDVHRSLVVRSDVTSPVGVATLKVNKDLQEFDNTVSNVMNMDQVQQTTAENNETKDERDTPSNGLGM